MWSMMKNKKIIWALIALLFIGIADAQQLLIRTTDVDGPLKVLGLEVIENNSYYRDYYLNEPRDLINYSFLFLNENNVTIYDTGAQFSSYTLLDYDKLKGATKIALRSNATLFESNLSFCNNNSVCESCVDDNCRNYENELSCNDCSSSSNDGFCNINNDGICDPDCVSGYVYEGENISEGCFEEVYLNSDCGNYYAIECNATQICSRGEFYLDTSEKTCCDGMCQDVSPFEGQTIIENYTNLNLKETKENTIENYYWVFITLGIIILSILLVYFFRKNKIITISLMSVFLVSSGVFLLQSNENKITGNIVSQQEIIGKICKAAEKYNVPGNIMLGVAAYEHGEGLNLQHWENNGKVVLSPDGGVGLFQITRNLPVPPDPKPHYVECGLSNWKRLFNVKDIDGNIECGALMLREKLAYYPNGRVYKCNNKLYTGWESAIRGYNGWGCPYKRNINYVEEVLRRANTDYFKNACGKPYTPLTQNQPPSQQPIIPITSTTPAEPEQTETKLPEEITSGEKIGYYYLNPSFTINLGNYKTEVYDTLINDAKKVIDDCNTKTSCSLKKCWELIGCKKDETSNKQQCKIEYETFYKTYYYDENTKKYLDEPGMKVKFALELDKVPRESNIECEPPDAPVTSTPAVTTTETPNSEACKVRDSYIHGIDVSHWNANINWQVVKESGIAFAFIKSSEGDAFIDNKFTFNIDNARANGIEATAYHFARPNLNTGKAEAEYFYKVIKGKSDKISMRPALDLEDGDELTTKQLSDWVIGFMETFKEKAGYYPIIYTMSSYINNELDARINKYDLWIANWGVSSPTVTREWDFWQYSETGRINGVYSNVDLNKFRGSRECMMARVGMSNNN